MSYCRVGEDSDVYVIRHVNGFLICYQHEPAYECRSEQSMICHLTIHRNAGDRVPQRALDRLEAERDGRPFKTDVMVALDSLHLDRLGVENPNDLLRVDSDPDH